MTSPKNLLCVDHLALVVESLRQAENFYMRLFGLRVLFREGTTVDGCIRWPAEREWEEVRASDLPVERSCLECDGFRLVLQLKTEETAPTGRIDYVCLRVKPEDLGALQTQAETLDCRLERPSPGELILEDPYGVRWKMVAG
ncbi:MAG: VOC family protein [Armatimonadetes bacterium]|nr:VOC family protein [Armatimonadota bacterium]